MKIETIGKCKMDYKIRNVYDGFFDITFNFYKPAYFICDNPHTIYSDKEFIYYSTLVHPMTDEISECVNDIIELRIYPENEDEKDGTIYCSALELQHKLIYHVVLKVFIFTKKYYEYEKKCQT